MAITVSPGSSATINVGAFSTITLTASAASTGSLSYAGGAMDNLRSDASFGLASKVYGPFGAPGVVTITVNSGVVTYDVTYTDSNSIAAIAHSGLPGIAPPKREVTVCVEGDSRADCTINKSLYGVSRLRDIGIACHAAAYAGGAVRIIESNQVGGTKAEQIYARIPAAIATGADEIWVPEMGINNMQGSAAATYDAASVKASILGAAQLVTDAGKIFRIGTPRPLASSHASFNATLVQRQVALRKWMIETLGSMPRVRVIDSRQVYLDESSGDGRAISGLIQSDDYIHINDAGAAKDGYQWAQSVLADYTFVDPLAASGEEKYSVAASDDQLLPNPFFIGTGGTNSSGLTGDVPASCRCVKTGGTLTGTTELVASADGRYNIWRLTVTNTNAAAKLLLKFGNVYTLLATGDVLDTFIGATYSGGAKVQAVQHEMWINSAVAASTLERSTAETLPYSDHEQATSGNIVGRTGRMTVGATVGTTCEQGITVDFAEAGGTIVLDVWRPRLKRVSRA